MIYFRVYGELVTKARGRTFDHPTKPGVHITTTPTKTRNWEKRIHDQALKVKPEKLLEWPIGMICIFWFDMPKTHRKKNTFLEPTFAGGNKDVDNLVKCVKDACQKVIYKNDSSIALSLPFKAYRKDEEYVDVWIGEPLEIMSKMLQIISRFRDMELSKLAKRLEAAHGHNRKNQQQNKKPAPAEENQGAGPLFEAVQSG